MENASEETSVPTDIFQKAKKLTTGREEQLAGNKLVEKVTVLLNGWQRCHRKGKFADNIFENFARTTRTAISFTPGLQAISEWRMRVAMIANVSTEEDQALQRPMQRHQQVLQE